ncbi:unnamed protein product [Dicrocoelium dendriticum]|nr:unnamed protein product [Dicrocoelium dendriticum]
MLLFRRFVARGPAFRAAAPGPTLLTVSPCYFSRTERDLAVFSKFRWSITTYLHAGHGSPRNPRLHAYYSSTVAAMTDAVANVIAEGSARIKLPEGVFYNRVQEFNRDLTVAVLQWFQKVHKKEWLMKNEKRLNSPSRLSQSQYSGLRILEALGGSGIRSVRFALEVPNIGEIVCNDLDERAVEMIHQNVLLNGVNKFVKVSNLDAVNLMHVYKEFSSRFNVVDIDPFGSASPFLDGAVQCLHSGGLLCVTATDMAVMCGSTPGTSMGKYGGMAVKNSAQQETVCTITFVFLPYWTICLYAGFVSSSSAR